MTRSTVLIVEDEEPLRTKLSRIARGCGFDVITAADGEEAMAALSAASVDIVLTDLLMPRMDGYSLIRWMHTHGMSQPVVVQSAYSSIENTVEVLRLGAYDYIPKPFKLEDVEASLRRAENVIERRRADAALRQRNRELAALNAISAAVNSSLELDEMLDRALDATIEALAMNGAVIYFGDTEKGVSLYRSYGICRYEPIMATPQIAVSQMSGVAIGESQVVEALGIAVQSGWHDDTAILAAIPLLSNGSLCGILLLIGVVTHPIQHDQLALLEAIGNYIGVAITNIRLYNQVRDSAVLLERLVEQRTRELQHSRDLLRTIFDGIPGGLLLADTNERVLATNRAYAALFDCRPSALVNRTHRQLWSASWGRATADLVQRCIIAGQPVYQRNRMERPGHSPMVLDHYLFPVYNGKGNVVQVIEYVEDVTERLALERMLTQTEQLAALGKLAATVAHEVNTPLLSIRGCLGLIANPKIEAAARSEYLALAEEELDRAAAIIRGILDFYRSDGSERVATDINALIEKVGKLLKARCAQRNVQVELQLSPILPAILITPDQIKQVVLNLMVNAIESLSDGGVIILRTSLRTCDEQQVVGQYRSTPTQWKLASGDNTESNCFDQQLFVVIEVEDTGNGIPQAVQDKIFDAFVTTKEEGSGLGLAVCRTIVHDHGGTITAENIAGSGACFTVTLPIASHEAEKNFRCGANGLDEPLQQHP